jgi:hypothetical protein
MQLSVIVMVVVVCKNFIVVLGLRVRLSTQQ